MPGKSAGPRAPVGLQARGRRMWNDSLATWSLTPAHVVLLEEACRTADRCEMLDKLIRSAMKRPRRPPEESGEDPGGPVEIPSLMAEARAQQTVLKGLLLELRQGQRPPGASTLQESGPTAGGSGVADLSKRIADRRRKASD